MKTSKEEKQRLAEEAKQDKKDLHNWEKFIERMKEKGALVEDSPVKKQKIKINKNSASNKNQNQNQNLNLFQNVTF